MNEHDRLVDRAARDAPHRRCSSAASTRASRRSRERPPRSPSRLGRTVAYLDADVGQKTVGPPATVGHEAHPRRPTTSTLDALAHADALGFVGSTSPQDHLLPLVGALARLRDRARAEGADLVVVDTSGHGRGHLRPAGEVPQGGAAPARPRRRAAARRGARPDPRGDRAVLRRSTSCRSPSIPAVVPDERRASGSTSASRRWRRYFERRPAAVPGQAHRVHADACRRCSTCAARPAPGGPVRRRRAHSPGIGYLEYVAGGGRAAPDLAGGRCPRKRLDWAPSVWRRATAPSGSTSGTCSEPNERRGSRCRRWSRSAARRCARRSTRSS